MANRARAVPHPVYSYAADDLQGLLERRLYIQCGGIEQDRIGGGLEGCRSPASVARIAASDVSEHLVKGNPLSAYRKLVVPAPGAGFRTRRDKYFHIRRGTNHGAGIAPIEDGTAGSAGEFLLDFEESGAHFGDRGHARSRLTESGTGKTTVFELVEIDVASRRHRSIDVV
jgi:hypothetical protein